MSNLSDQYIYQNGISQISQVMPDTVDLLSSTLHTEVNNVVPFNTASSNNVNAADDDKTEDDSTNETEDDSTNETEDNSTNETEDDSTNETEDDSTNETEDDSTLATDDDMNETEDDSTLATDDDTNDAKDDTANVAEDDTANAAEDDIANAAKNNLVATLLKKRKLMQPPHIQTYYAVLDELRDIRYKGKLQKIVDFGCGDLSFLYYIVKMTKISEIVCVDIDGDILSQNCHKAKNLTKMSYRKYPFVIKLCKGNAIHNDVKMHNTDAVVCIELIQHMDQLDLKYFVSNIFGFIMPKIVVITTPNQDFNILLTDHYGLYRHKDHKFEWSIKEFQQWAHGIVQTYSAYSVEFHGICDGPEGTDCGSHTQMAVFHKDLQYDRIIRSRCTTNNIFEIVNEYHFSVNMNYYSDDRKLRHKAVNCVLNYINETNMREIPLANINNMLSKFSITIETLKMILMEHDFLIDERENGPVIALDTQVLNLSRLRHLSESSDYADYADNRDPNDYGDFYCTQNQIDFEFEMLDNESSGLDEDESYEDELGIDESDIDRSVSDIDRSVSDIDRSVSDIDRSVSDTYESASELSEVVIRDTEMN